MLARDIALLLRVILYYGNITLHGEENDPEEFLSKPSNVAVVMKNLERYFGSGPIDPNSKLVSYEEFVDFAY